MIFGKWFVTPHAVRAYIERWARGKSFEEAREDLIRLSEVARLVRETSPGIFLYRAPRPHRFRLIVSTRFEGEPQLVTVLKGWEGQRSGAFAPAGRTLDGEEILDMPERE